MKVEVRTKALDDAVNGLKGFANVTIGDCFAIHNISIVESKEGNLFVSMPSYKSKQIGEEGNPVYKDICNPVTKDFREKLNNAVLESYKIKATVIFEHEQRDPNQLIEDTISQMDARGEFPFDKGFTKKDVGVR